MILRKNKSKIVYRSHWVKSGGFYSKNKEREIKKMDKNTYTLIGKFECCGKTMVTVIIKIQKIYRSIWYIYH